MNYLSKMLLVSLGVGLVAYITICLFLFFWQRRIVFVPSSVIENTPDQLGFTFEEVWLPMVNEAGETEKIHGWWIPAAADSSKVLLYLHGNGMNIGANLGRVGRYLQLGFSVLIIDYRGYGRSEGNFPDEFQVYQDAQTAWDYLVQQRGVKPENLFLYGHSLGGAIAIDLAIANPQVAGLIVECTFTSLSDLSRYRQAYRLLPIDLLLTQRFDSLSKIKSLDSPILIIHGRDDLVVPAIMSETLFAAAEVPKQLLIIPDAGHNDVASVGGEEYLQGVRNFLELVKNKQNQLTQS